MEADIARAVAALVLLSLTAAPAFAQHLGEREQWQPQTRAPDPRLDQPVEVEIIGRAAGPALQLLSDRTGVSLGVAPENLDTVGERKLTIISTGLPLRVIMVQLPEALQEAHWDVTEDGGQSVYLLHRNSAVDIENRLQRQRRFEEYKQEWEASRSDRVELARRALAMSPEELKDLEQTDLLLARAAREPIARAMMEAFLALPSDLMAQFLNTGQLKFGPGEAPSTAVRAAQLSLQQQLRLLEWIQSWPAGEELPPFDEEINWRAHLEELEDSLAKGKYVAIHFWANGRESGLGIDIVGDFGGQIVPARYPSLGVPALYEQFLLVQTGDDRTEALETTKRLSDEWSALIESRSESLSWDESDWVEPRDPRLQQKMEICAPGNQNVHHLNYSEMQQLVAAATGLSIVSDYFTYDVILIYPEQRLVGKPLWRDLYVLGQSGRYHWKLVGDCLVFYRKNWHWLARRELPESLIADYLGRIEQQGHLTLEDMAELAVTLVSRPAAGMGGPFTTAFTLPAEFRRPGAGSAAHPRSRWALLLWGALSPDERAAAEGERGLCFADLTYARRAALTATAWPTIGPPGVIRIPEGRLDRAVFRLHRAQGVDELGSRTRCDLSIEFSDASRDPMAVTVSLYEMRREVPSTESSGSR